MATESSLNMKNVSNEQFDKNDSSLNNSAESLKSALPKEITVTVETAENIDCCKVKEIKVKMEFAGEVLGQSDPIPVTKCSTDIGLNGIIFVNDLSPQFLDEVLANPILFTVYDCTKQALYEEPPPSSSPKPEKPGKNKTSKTSASTVSVPKAQASSGVVLGIGNLDIGGFITGNNIIRETIILESEKKVRPPEAPTWVKLPRMVVFATTGDKSLIPDATNQFNNIVGVTVESVYNVPENVSEGTVFEAKIPISSFKDKTDYLLFPNGVVSEKKDYECRKKWLNLSHLEGNGGRSKYVIDPDYSDVINTVSERLNLEKELKKKLTHIHWNTWRNCLMVQSSYNYFFSKLMKYRTWPIEIYSVNKTNEQKTVKSEKKSKPTAPETPATPNHFIAFLDLSTLLYPGVTKARVAAQLYTYSQTDLVNKFGADFAVTVSQSSVATVKSKAVSERSKIITKEAEPIKDAPGVPLFNEHESPTFIIVEVEFFKPFTPKRDPEYLHEQLQHYVSLKGKTTKKEVDLTRTQNNFSNSIKAAVAIITAEYQKFSQKTKDCQENFNTNFWQYMCQQENFSKINTTLESKVLELLNEKYGELRQYDEKLPEIYVYLVEEMYKITNKCASKNSSGSEMYLDNLQLYAEEAFEDENFELAKEYQLMKLSRQTSNPDYWLDYAVFCVNLDENEEAVEAVKEALVLDPNHRMGLLIYALLMTRFQKNDIAELCFEVLLSKHPEFIEGWALLGFFYQTISNYEGRDVANRTVAELRRHKQLSEDENLNLKGETICQNLALEENYRMPNKSRMASFVKEYNFKEPLSWSFLLSPQNNINLTAAILMLRFGFHEYAVMALSQNMILEDDDESPHYLYYLAVSHYLQGRYEETMYQLETFVKNFGKNYLAWGLMGHCYYKLGNHKNAIACYEYVLETYNRQDDVHLIYLRMGYYYLRANKYLCAKQILITGCKYSPSPKLWKGVGIACLRLCEFEDAEIAFSEANFLDNRDPENWAYLALTNVSLGRLQLFKQCYTEAKKRSLSNLSLLKELECCMSLNFSEDEE